MSLDPFLEAALSVTVGVVLYLIGHRLREQYRREYADPRAREVPENDMAEWGLRRGAVTFLTCGVMFVVLGLGLAAYAMLR